MKTNVKITLTLIFAFFCFSFLQVSFKPNSHTPSHIIIVIDDDNGSGNEPGSLSSRSPIGNISCQPISENSPFSIEVYDSLYYFSSNIVNYDELRFDFQVQDIAGNNLEVSSGTYPQWGGTGTFRMQFDLNNRPSWVYALSPNSLSFLMEYEVELPPYITPTGQVFIHFTLFRRNYGGTWEAANTMSSPLDICSGSSIPFGGFRNSDLSSISNDLQIDVYPNPVKDYLEVHIPSSKKIKPELVLMDMAGKSWALPNKAKRVSEEKWILSVDSKNLPAGVYVCQVRVGEHLYFQKITK